MISEQEVESHCPYCNSEISFVCEIETGGQTYIEDCEICCKPIKITYSVSDGEITDIVSRRLDD